MNPLLKAREVAYYLGDSGARLLFAWHGFADEASAGAKRAERRGGHRRPCRLRRGARVRAARPGGGRAAGRRHRGDPLHLGHHRPAEGRRADPRQPGQQRRGDARPTCCSSTADDVIFGGLPLFHSFGQTVHAQHRGRRRARRLTLLPRFDPARALEILAGHRVTVFAGVPTMYARAAARPDRGRRTTCPRCGCASRAAPRCRSRCCAASRRRSAAWCWRATACRRPRRWPRSTTPTGSASPARSARRSAGVEMRVVDDAGRRGPAGRGRRDRDPRPQHHEGLLAAPGGDGRGDPATAGSAPATSAGSTRTATSSSSTGRRT